MDNRYQIVDYDRKFRDRIIQLLNEHLWFDSFERSMAYFRYKYEQNPYRAEPIGLVVLHGQKVVGFRAFFPTKWQLGNDTRNLIPMLSPTETVIHSAHQRQGLFGELIKTSFRRFEQGEHQAFINLSANMAARNGALKFEWKLLSAITFARHYSFSGLLKYTLINKFRYKPKGLKLKYGRFGKIETTDVPRIKEMAELLNYNDKMSTKLYLYKDENYLAYRYKNPNQKYHFFYYWEKGELKGFLCVRSIGNHRNAHIIDYAQESDDILEEIIDFITQKEYFDIISVWSFGLQRNNHPVFSKMNFKTNTLITRLKNKSKNMQYVLIRPAKENLNDPDWFIEGQDIRNVNTWDFRELCADDA